MKIFSFILPGTECKSRTAALEKCVQRYSGKLHILLNFTMEL